MIFRLKQDICFGIYDRNEPIYNEYNLRRVCTFKRTAHGISIAHQCIAEKLYSIEPSYIFHNWETRNWGWLGVSRNSGRVGLVVGERDNSNYSFYVLHDGLSGLWVGNLVHLQKSSVERLPQGFVFESRGKPSIVFQEL